MLRFSSTSLALVFLVAVDVVTKVAAVLLLTEGRPVHLDALFQFALQPNETGLSTEARARGVFAPEYLAGIIGFLALALGIRQKGSSSRPDLAGRFRDATPTLLRSTCV